MGVGFELGQTGVARPVRGTTVVRRSVAIGQPAKLGEQLTDAVVLGHHDRDRVPEAPTMN